MWLPEHFKSEDRKKMMDEKRIESAIKEISEETELFKKLLRDDDE